MTQILPQYDDRKTNFGEIPPLFFLRKNNYETITVSVKYTIQVYCSLIIITEKCNKHNKTYIR